MLLHVHRTASSAPSIENLELVFESIVNVMLKVTKFEHARAWKTIKMARLTALFSLQEDYRVFQLQLVNQDRPLN